MKKQLAFLVLVVLLSFTGSCSNMTKEKAHQKLQTLLEKTVAKNDNLQAGLLLVHSEKHKIHWKMAGGTFGLEKKTMTPDHTFHIASIGKTMTSAVIGKLVEAGKLSYADPIAQYLPPEIMVGLHNFNGQSYADSIQIRHLLNHTSGIPDYFEEKPENGMAILELAVEQPHRFWTPQETIQWAKEHLKPHFPPGTSFSYSDTGYQLLGLIIENVTGKPMHESLHELIFQPLLMEHSYQLFYSEPQKKSPYPIAEIYLGKHEVSQFNSLSIDWAGGGVISNTADLCRFMSALINNEIVSAATFEQWTNWVKFSGGMYYGYGLVQLKFHELMFLLPAKLDCWGNWGSTSTYMFYNPTNDVIVIGAFNQTEFLRKQVQFMIKVLTIMSKLKN